MYALSMSIIPPRWYYGPRFTKNLKSDRNRKHISGAKMRFTRIILL